MTFRVVPEPPEIGDTDGFSKSDIFEARESGERLANIVGEIEGPCSIVLDGPWGSGKSVFVKQWAGLLRQRGHPVVYFDAFEHDHLDDAFFPLFGHLLQAHSDGEPALGKFQEKLVGHATTLAKATPRILADVALRSATGGILDTSRLRDAVQDFAYQSTEAKVKECIGSADLMSSCVQSFRKALTDAVSDAGTCCCDPKIRSLVFVIDELDRCRPSYALSILERMKHLFTVDGICFVFVTHLEALARMVRREYGLTDDKDRDYLDKFFQLRFDIRSLLFRSSEKRRQQYLSHLASSIGMEWSPSHSRAMIMNNLVRLHDISLRSQERIMLNRLLASRATENQVGGSIHPFGDRDLRYTLADCLCVMREASPSLYRKAPRGELEYSDAMGFLRLGEWAETPTGLQQSVKFCWKLTATGGLDELTEHEKERLRQLDYAGSYERLLASVCTYIDQVAQ